MNTTKSSVKRRIAALLIVVGASVLGVAQLASPAQPSANGVFID